MSTAEEITRVVQPLLDEIKSSVFNDGYNASNEEAMGILLARYFGWDGISILSTASYGLEDSNFHTLSGKVDKLIAAENRSEAAAVRRQAKAAGIKAAKS
jgi:hypothetical protein